MASIEDMVISTYSAISVLSPGDKTWKDTLPDFKELKRLSYSLIA